MSESQGHGDRRPGVAVIVVNWERTGLTMECLRSVVATEWPAERLRVLLIDNSDDPELVRRVAAETPSVQRIATGQNVGFAEACNIGFRIVSESPEFELIALVNNDATVEPGWLVELATMLASSRDLGAVAPKILFAPRFHELSIRGRAGQRLRLEVDAVDVTAQCQPGDGVRRDPDGTLAVEHGVATVYVPAHESCPAVMIVAADPTRSRESIPFEGSSIDLVNNLGTELRAGGHGADRLFRTVDDGGGDEPTEVFAFSGGGALLRRAMLDEVGFFDPRFFTYYEDLDLAWRARRAGWRFVTAPQARIRHHHTATTREGSPEFWFHNDRNRLLTLARNDTIGALVRAVLVAIRALVSLVRHRHGGQWVSAQTQARALALMSFAALLPTTLRTRRPGRARSIGRVPPTRLRQPFHRWVAS